MGSLELSGTAGVSTRVFPRKDFLRISKTRERWLVCLDKTFLDAFKEFGFHVQEWKEACRTECGFSER